MKQNNKLYFVIENAHIISCIFETMKVSNKYENKSRGTFRNWTFLKMSKIEKPKYFLKKGLKK